MAKVNAKLKGVRAWNGIPGIDVAPQFARRLINAKVPVSVFTIESERRVPKQTSFVANASWGSAPGADFIGSPPDAIIGGGPADYTVIPAKLGYRVAVPLARLEPDAELAVWVARTFEPDELAAMYKFQETGSWEEYLRGLRAESGEAPPEVVEDDDGNEDDEEIWK